MTGDRRPAQNQAKALGELERMAAFAEELAERFVASGDLDLAAEAARGAGRLRVLVDLLAWEGELDGGPDGA